MKQKPDSDPSEGRIAKVLARAGVCSRRAAEVLITEGRVSVDGEILRSPAINVKPGQDIRVDGMRIPSAEPPRMWRYHKPRGVLSTSRDPQGRPTLFEALPKDLPRVVSVGRLDFNSEGLLLLTNDGELARRLELPASGLTRRYRVRAFGRPDQAALDRLREGVSIEGLRYGPIHATVERASGDNCWIGVALREGKNREVRNVLAHLGLQVNRLIRVSYGPFHLGDLKPGEAAEISRDMVMEQLGHYRDRTGWAKAAPRKKRGEKKK